MSVCRTCNEAITNPLCDLCLTEEVVQWLGDKKPTLVPLIRDVSKLMVNLEETSVNCISCKNPLRMCAFCYYKEIGDFVDTNLHDQFNDVFHFSLTKQERAV